MPSWAERKGDGGLGSQGKAANLQAEEKEQTFGEWIVAGSTWNDGTQMGV